MFRVIRHISGGVGFGGRKMRWLRVGRAYCLILISLVALLLHVASALCSETTATPLIVGHRGASSIAPENTLAAALAALLSGADMWELDVRLTADGVPVLMHDPTLLRTTNVRELFPERRPLRVQDFTLAEIKQLDAGTWFVKTDPFGTIASGEVPPEIAHGFVGEPVPTLREALIWSRQHGLPALVEIKGSAVSVFLTPHKRALVEAVVAVIRDLGVEDQVILCSFDHRIVRYSRRVAPDLPVVAGFLQFPVDPVGFLREIGAAGASLHIGAYRPSTAARLHEAGLSLFLWTVNDPIKLRSLSSEQLVSAIITDWPQHRTLTGEQR